MRTTSKFDNLPVDVMLRVNEIYNRFEGRWQSGEQPRVEDMYDDTNAGFREAIWQELLPIEIEYRQRAGQEVPTSSVSAWFSTSC